MKLSTGINILSNKNIEKGISKKILLANTVDKSITGKQLSKAVSSPSDPVYFTNQNQNVTFNPDIRYRNAFMYSPLTHVNYRNDLLVFAENNEVKKAVNIIVNEIALMESESHRYPVFPKINFTQVDEDKQDVAKAIDEYLNTIFFPKLYQFYDMKEEGLLEIIKSFVITGKLAFEILFDNLKNPKEIIGIIPIDPATLQKVKKGDYIYYIQRPVVDANKERVMQENQVILVEWNKYDFGFISYVDQLRLPFNTMRSMQTSKVLWFAAKSQVRMHIKLAMGDVARTDAIQKLTESKNQYTNMFSFNDDGTVYFNNQPNNSGYREFFTAETAASGSPEIEEINTQGPDLTEVDSLQFWEKLFWKQTEIPYDRIDPNSSDSWGFTDVSQMRKIEINFGKYINYFRKLLNPLFLKPIVMQLTLKEAEIGIDLSLLDSIKMEWSAFNQYEKLAELEVMNKRVELATNIAAFGELEDVNGKMRKTIPLTWIVKNYLEYSEDQLKSMETVRRAENKMLGFSEETVPEVEDEEEIIEETSLETESLDDDAQSIADKDDKNF